MTGRLKPREQGDIGERAAVEWLWSQGAIVFIPFGHSPDFDLIADMRDGRLLKVQVKTTTQCLPNGRFLATICTRGGNRSWNGIAKYFSASRCDYLFVLAADGRQFFIPASEIEGGTAVVVGGPKYARFEVEQGRPITAARAA